MNLSKSLRNVRSVFLAILLGVAGAASFSNFIAEFIALGPRTLMNEMRNTGQIPEDWNFEPAYKILLVASKIKPLDASLHFELGRLSWWQAKSIKLDVRKRQALLDRSEKHLSTVTELRPTWGRGWVELANVRLQSGKYMDAKFALMRGIRVSPYEVDSSWLAMWTAFSLWGFMDWDEKDQVMQMAKYVLENGIAVFAIDSAVRFYKEDVIQKYIEPGTENARRLEWRLKLRDSEGLK